jgi:hypothetical protein
VLLTEGLPETARINAGNLIFFEPLAGIFVTPIAIEVDLLGLCGQRNPLAVVCADNF